MGKTPEVLRSASPDGDDGKVFGCACERGVPDSVLVWVAGSPDRRSNFPKKNLMCLWYDVVGLADGDGGGGRKRVRESERKTEGESKRKRKRETEDRRGCSSHRACTSV